MKILKKKINYLDEIIWAKQFFPEPEKKILHNWIY